MPSRPEDPDEYELVNRNTFESDEDFDLDDADFQSNGRTTNSYVTKVPLVNRARALLLSLLPTRLKRKGYRRLTRQRAQKASLPAPRRLCRPSRKCYFLFHTCLGLVFALIILTGIFNPSYTRPPVHYQEIRKTIEASKDYGRGNPDNQKIFIAASIYDEGGHLLGGAWGRALLELIDILGNKNVFLSIYENDSGVEALTAKINLEQEVQCKHRFEYDRDFTAENVPHVKLPDGSERVKRIAFLAEIRNKALEPLEEQPHVKYDKILYLNDVIFDPTEAAQLLLSTNLDEDGHTSYRAACALDFINPFKFYDTFAARDSEGYSMGVPFFPWFTGSGNGISRKDVLDGKDAVRVKSCWGGMVAFDAKPFQATSPLRFRASEDLYWDASECCLIHADLMGQGVLLNEDGFAVGIYMNPFVRVAYSQRTLSWLRYTRRFERLYTIPHSIINRLVGLPWFNPRRTEEVGEKVEEKVWVSDNALEEGGSFQMREREATGDGFCGRRGLQLIRETPRDGEKNWENVPVPPG